MKAAYTVVELEPHKDKEVHRKRTVKEFEALSEAKRKSITLEDTKLKDAIREARLKKDSPLVASLTYDKLVLNGIKERDLRLFGVTFPRKHSNTFDEVTMNQQGLFLKAPNFHEEANEIEPGSIPEGYIGLAPDEFIVSYVEPPVFITR